MAEQSVECAVREHAQAAVEGDFGRTIRDMTPEAFAKAMLMELKQWTYAGYTIEYRSRDEEDYLFQVRYLTDAGAATICYRFREMDGVWRVIDVDLIARPERVEAR